MEKGIAICFRVFWLLAQEEYRLNALQHRSQALLPKCSLRHKLKGNLPKGSEYWGVVIFNT